MMGGVVVGGKLELVLKEGKIGEGRKKTMKAEFISQRATYGFSV